MIIVHGWGGSPEKNWLPWLADELKRAGHEVVVPTMPDTEAPAIEKWVPFLTEIVGAPDADTYFVGHSIGCQTIMRYVETINTKIGGALFVAGWFNLENLESGEEDVAKPWIEMPIDHAKVRANMRKATLIISNNDDFGAFEENKKGFSDIVDKTLVLHNVGHITGPKYPEILSEALALFC